MNEALITSNISVYYNTHLQRFHLKTTLSQSHNTNMSQIQFTSALKHTFLHMASYKEGYALVVRLDQIIPLSTCWLIPHLNHLNSYLWLHVVPFCFVVYYHTCYFRLSGPCQSCFCSHIFATHTPCLSIIYNRKQSVVWNTVEMRCVDSVHGLIGRIYKTCTQILSQNKLVWAHTLAIT